MKAMIYKLSKAQKSVIASVLALVMVFGVFAFIAPMEAQAISVDATDAGFYNIAYGENGKTTFGPSTQIRVINYTRQGKSKNDAVYQLDGMNWQPVDPNKYIVWEGITDNIFYGVYPYDAEYDSFTIPTDQSGGVQVADWMTDDFTANKSEGKVQFDFRHRLAKVTVNITKWNNEFVGTEQITVPKIYTKGTNVTATYENGSATITATGEDTGIDPYVDSTSYTAIVAPAAYDASDKFMTFKVGEQEMTVLATASQLTEGLKPGNHYTFDLAVGKDVVEITEVKVNGWNEENINGGSAEAVEVTTVLSGTTATLIIPELATDALVQEALKELNTEGITTVNVDGLLNENRQKYIADALKDKTVNLYLAQLTEDELIDELASDDDNITVICGYYIADDSTFVVYTAEGLQEWNTNARTTNPAANLSLKKDVTLPLADGATSNWTSVGTESVPYTGTVDGNGYSITGMTINQTTNDAGFIGYLGENGWVKNLTLKDVSVTSTQGYVGGFVGRAYHTTVIENCAVESGTISASGNNVGGIVGYMIGSKDPKLESLIIACNNKATVTSNGYRAGGILGASTFDSFGMFNKIIACYNSGAITSVKGKSAGIAGDVYNGGASVYCNYNTGETNGKCAIKGRDEGAEGHNYWSSSHNWANGTYVGTDFNNDGATKITDASQWENAMATMNTWLTENGYEYRYVLNTDAATKDAQPLIIVKAS